jgi:hypothetical protein
VDYFRRHLIPFMAAYGYEDEWTLATEPEIRSEYSADFVRRSVELRRDQSRHLMLNSDHRL